MPGAEGARQCIWHLATGARRQPGQRTCQRTVVVQQWRDCLAVGTGRARCVVAFVVGCEAAAGAGASGAGAARLPSERQRLGGIPDTPGQLRQTAGLCRVSSGTLPPVVDLMMPSRSKPWWAKVAREGLR